MSGRDDRPPTWSAGAWFGSQLGSTAWLLVSAAVLLGRSRGLALLVLAWFLVPNLAGAWLWSRRRTISMHRALQGLLAAVGACSIAAVYAIDSAGHWTTLAVGGTNNISAGGMYVLIVGMVAGLALMFELQERARTKGRGD